MRRTTRRPAWLASLDDELYRKLSSERVALAAPRVAAETAAAADKPALAAFLDGYIAGRTTIKADHAIPPEALP